MAVRNNIAMISPLVPFSHCIKRVNIVLIPLNVTRLESSAVFGAMQLYNVDAKLDDELARSATNIAERPILERHHKAMSTQWACDRGTEVASCKA